MSGNKIKVQFCKQPRYFNDFHCIGGACPMTCCYGWGNIDWTKDEVEKLKCAECSEELKSLIEKTFVENGSKYNVKYNEKGFCPLLDENGLCRVQKELGVEYMSKTCIIYPRHSIISGNTAINYCNISCYHIMDTLCRQKDSMAIENLLPKSAKVKEMATDIDGANDVLKSPELKFRNQLFDLFYDIISDESYSLETALTLGALAANNLDKIVRSGETNRIPDIIPSLKKQLKNPEQIKKLEDIKPNYSVKLGFAKKLDEVVIKLKLIDGLCENGVLSADKFNEGMRRFNAEFYERTFALRNIALNLLLELKIPFRDKNYSIFENYCFYAAVAAVKLTAASIFVKNNESQAMVNPVVTGSDKVADAVRNMKISFKIKTDSEHEFKTRLAYIDRFFAHNNNNVKVILDMYKELNCMSPAYIALIVK